MSNVRLVPSLLLLALGGATPALLLGCVGDVPPRPVPQLEAQPELPPWFPEEPWNARGKQDRLFLEGKILFDTDKSTIRPEGQKVLEQLLAWLQQNPDISQLRLEGHTDHRATEEHNQKLSERRSIAVADWLVDHGLDHNRLVATAFGETRPIAPNDTAVGMQENRRAAFRPAEVSGRRFRDEDPTGGGLVLIVLSKEEREALKKQGEVPKDVRPPFKPEGNIIRPVPPANAPGKDILQETQEREAEEKAKEDAPKGGANPAPQPDAAPQPE